MRLILYRIMTCKPLFFLSLLLNILLLGILFQFRDKIYARFFPPEKVNILLIGDSLLAQENWNLLLQRNDVKNEAYGGAITQQILWNLERGQLNSKPKIVILEGGINDLLVGVSSQRVFENYLKIFNVLKQQNIPFISHAIILTDDPSINQEVLKLNQLLKAYCLKNGIVYLDMNAQLSINQQLAKEYSFDGIHLTKTAYQHWAKALIGCLEKIVTKIKVP
jgi:lysophospholipase L1-like esterase